MAAAAAGEGDTVLKCPISRPSPPSEWNKENSALFLLIFSSLLSPPADLLSLASSLPFFSARKEKERKEEGGSGEGESEKERKPSHE